jgi:hypothetical protein
MNQAKHSCVIKFNSEFKLDFPLDFVSLVQGLFNDYAKHLPCAHPGIPIAPLCAATSLAS